MGKKEDKTQDLKRLTKAMEEVLENKRFQHTIGVEYTAAALAMKYGADLYSAQVAGLLHDCAKCYTDEKRTTICRKNKLEITESEKQNPVLLHSKVGAFLAQKEYGVGDPDILNAIRYHTTGRPKMSLLEKIVFVADYIEPGRKQAPNLAEIRRTAFEDLDQALLMILKDTLDYLEDGDGEVDSMTRETYDYYCNNEF